MNHSVVSKISFSSLTPAEFHKALNSFSSSSVGADGISLKVSHKILLAKLKDFGLFENSVNWFESYLTNRRQAVVRKNRTRSNWLTIKCGVLQGSVLGPLME